MLFCDFPLKLPYSWSGEHAHDDMEVRALREAQLEATQLIEAIRSAKKIDGAILSEQEAEAIAEASEELQSAIEQGSSIQLHELTEKLNHVSGDFAARRMDLHIGKALRGESIDKVGQSSE